MFCIRLEKNFFLFTIISEWHSTVVGYCCSCSGRNCCCPSSCSWLGLLLNPVPQVCSGSFCPSPVSYYLQCHRSVQNSKEAQLIGFQRIKFYQSHCIGSLQDSKPTESQIFCLPSSYRSPGRCLSCWSSFLGPASTKQLSGSGVIYVYNDVIYCIKSSFKQFHLILD